MAPLCIAVTLQTTITEEPCPPVCQGTETEAEAEAAATNSLSQIQDLAAQCKEGPHFNIAVVWYRIVHQCAVNAD